MNLDVKCATCNGAIEQEDYEENGTLCIRLYCVDCDYEMVLEDMGIWEPKEPE